MKDESDKRGLKYSKVTNSSFKQLPKSEKFDTMERSTSKHLNLLCRTCSVNEDSIVERISIPYRTCRSLNLARFFRLDAHLAIFSRIEIFKCVAREPSSVSFATVKASRYFSFSFFAIARLTRPLLGPVFLSLEMRRARKNPRNRFHPAYARR